MNLIDTHCHLDSVKFDHDREQVLQSCIDKGLSAIIVPGVTACRWRRVLALCQQSKLLYPALGLHPMYLEKHSNDHLTLLRDLLEQHYPIAVGEIGLDYYLPDVDRGGQVFFLERQFELAKEFNLPVILHCRKAHDQMLSLLTKHQLVGGVAHAFNGSLRQAKQYIELGFKLGFGGMLTYPRSTKLRGLARELPLNSIVLETDAPDLTVVQHRGQRNSPAYLPYVLAALAQVRTEEPIDKLADQTARNALEVFDLIRQG